MPDLTFWQWIGFAAMLSPVFVLAALGFIIRPRRDYDMPHLWLYFWW